MTSAPVPEKLLLSARETAKALSISEKTLWTYTQRGNIPCAKIGARVLYSVESLQRFIAEAERQGGQNE